MSINCLNSIGKFLYSVGSFIASPFVALIQKIQSLFANKIGNNSAASTAAPSINGRVAATSEISSAARVNNLKGVQALLAKGDISDSDRAQAVKEAAQGGHLACIEALVACDGERFRAQAVAFAARGGHLDCVEALIACDDGRLRGHAVENAAQGGHRACVEALLSKGDISIDNRTKAGFIVLRHFGSIYGLAIIRALSVNGPFNNILLTGAFVEGATKMGDLACIQALLAHGPISPGYRSQAVIDAAQRGHLEIIQALLSNGPINEREREDAVREAAQRGHLEIIQALLAGIGNNEDPLRRTAVRLAFLNGHLDCAQALLPPGVNLEAYIAIVGHAAVLAAADGGINVHDGARDQLTQNAVLSFYASQNPGPNADDIETLYQQLIAYINTKPQDLKDSALLALNAPKIAMHDFGPLVGGGNFSYLGHEIDGKELVARLWHFASQIADPMDQINAKDGMVAALTDSSLGGHVVCNQGKTQRLMVAVVQGRMAGINIEAQDFGTVTTAAAINMFFANEANQEITTKDALIAAARTFCNQNPHVVKEAFLADINRYAEENLD